MALSPQSIREQQFKPARRGYDQDEVERFRTEVADALEAAQNEATAMEARARAAVARLQELSKSPGRDTEDHEAPGPVARERSVDVHPSVDESETISRTLLLAQRTADTTIADARAEADRLLTLARQDADGELDSARGEAGRLVAEARDEARRAGESERVRVEGEVQALLARRDFLESDVDHLEQFIAAQRERITEAVAELNDIVQRIPNGLADMRRPLLSAAADEPAGAGDEPEVEIAEITRVANGADDERIETATNGDGGSEDAADGTGGASDDETGDVWARRDEPASDAADAADVADTTEAGDGDSASLFDPDERT